MGPIADKEIPVSDETLALLLAHLPHLVKVIESEEGVAELDEYLEASLLRVLDAHGFPLSELDKDSFVHYTFRSYGELYEGIIEEAEWARIVADMDSARAIEFVKAWDSWTHDEAFSIFSKDYEVKQISEMTAPRWRAFLAEWGKLTLAARRAVFEEYFTQAFTDLDTPMDWQVQFAAGAWPGPVEVPFVEAKPRTVKEAVPRGADGKEVKL